MVINKKGQNCEIHYDSTRFTTQAKNAHKRLNMLVVGDSTPYVPFKQGQLRSQVRYPDGIYGDWIEWYAPYAHYQYEGNILTDDKGRTFVKKNEVKPINTGRPLSYNTSGTGDHWFERAKEAHKPEWVKEVKRIAGGN